MDDVRCPKCRGGLRTCHRALGYEAVCAEDCGFVGPMLPEPRMALEACRHLCWREVRHRLPTEEEEAAHQERHGEKAGWMVCDYASDWRQPSKGSLHHMRSYAAEKPCYPHVNGRPVAGPEGW